MEIKIKGFANLRDAAEEIGSLTGAKITKGARKKAVGKAITKAKTKLKRDIVLRTGVPAKIIQKRLFSSRTTNTGPRTIRGIRVLVGAGVAAGQLKPKDIRPRGVRVQMGNRRSQVFPKAWLHGDRYVLRRKGASRLPLELVVLPIDKPVQRAVSAFMRTGKLERDFLGEYNRLLQVDLKKALTRYAIKNL